MANSLAVLIGSVAILSATLSFGKEPTEIAEEFFAKVKAGEVSGAYDFLFAGSGIPEMKPQMVEVAKTQTTTILPLLGPVLGEELVREEKFGSAVTRLVYILRQEKAPTVWQFYFYKPKDAWIVSLVGFNDQFQTLEAKK